MGRVLAVGDIHGAHIALNQVLERCNFDNENDCLIQLGDVADGFPYVYECVEKLLSIKNLIAIKGNHDEWFAHFIRTGQHGSDWQQGAMATKLSYIRHIGTVYQIPLSHKEFFLDQELYYIDSSNRMFVHGGWDRGQTVETLKRIKPYDFYWDRSLWNSALSCSKGQILKTFEGFEEIFIGHTTTENWTYEDGSNKFYLTKDLKGPRTNKVMEPMFSGGVHNLDTGAGWSGKLTIMDVDTKEYWQSDNVLDIYPSDVKGRYNS